MNENSKPLIESIIGNEGTNVQTLITDKPDKQCNIIKLYLISKKHGLKEFTANQTLELLMNKKTCGCAFGTTTDDEEKDKVGIVLAWE